MFKMARDGSKTKELIARTALKLFVEKGVTATTIQDIASAAGIAEGTLYRHYEGKGALAWELFSENFTAFALELDRLQEEHQTLRGKIEAMTRQFCAFFDQDPIMFSYLLLAQHEQFKKVTPEMPSPVRVVRSAIEAGMARGEVPEKDANVATAMVMGVVLQVAVFKIYEGINQSLSSLSGTLFEACWRVLG
jgi:AcrR family transcriptional regulator